MDEPTKRFTHTVEHYLRYRPNYPAEILPILIENCSLTRASVIADIGSGTGLLTKLFLDYGNEVFGIEPNDAMRIAGEKALQPYAQFHSIKGTAEQTYLADQSIDFVTAGTAFHWFNQAQCQQEFHRILRSPGWVVLIWNLRDISTSPLMQEYEALIKKYGSYAQDAKAQLFDETVQAQFFYPEPMHIFELPHHQVLDWSGLQGRLLSTSYALKPSAENFPEMMASLKKIYESFQNNGSITFQYITKIYLGRFK